jgi:hypothetical protein
MAYGSKYTQSEGIPTGETEILLMVHSQRLKQVIDVGIDGVALKYLREHFTKSL